MRVKTQRSTRAQPLPPTPRLRNIVRTILLNGYIIDSFARPATGAFLILVRKRDVLGGEARIVLLFADTVSSGLRSRLVGDAKRHDAAAVHISERIPNGIANGIQQIALADFYNLLGGEIRTDRIFAKNLRRVMDELGHNRVPSSFSGKPDDLLEAYSEECLEFLLECPVRRYGQERRFEPLPDGLALGRNKFNLYFDSKRTRESSILRRTTYGASRHTFGTLTLDIVAMSDPFRCFSLFLVRSRRTKARLPKRSLISTPNVQRPWHLFAQGIWQMLSPHARTPIRVERLLAGRTFLSQTFLK